MQRPIDDFGLDGIVAVGDNTHLTPYEFGVQIKASSRFNVVRSCIVVPRVPREAIDYWARKFFPTLIVAYDTTRKVGYFDWVSNLVDLAQLQSKNRYFYLYIRTERVVGGECWAVITDELKNFHREFSRALRGAREIIPVAATLAGLLRNLCTSKMADLEVRDELMLYTMAQAWTHEEVIRQLDRLIPNVEPGSVAASNLSNFRSAYLAGCKAIFRDFEKQLSVEGVKWIMMKKLPDAEPILNELTAMLADCVSGLLSYVDRAE